LFRFFWCRMIVYKALWEVTFRTHKVFLLVPQKWYWHLLSCSSKGFKVIGALIYCVGFVIWDNHNSSLLSTYTFPKFTIWLIGFMSFEYCLCFSKFFHQYLFHPILVCRSIKNLYCLGAFEIAWNFVTSHLLRIIGRKRPVFAWTERMK